VKNHFFFTFAKKICYFLFDSRSDFKIFTEIYLASAVLKQEQIFFGNVVRAHRRTIAESLKKIGPLNPGKITYKNYSKITK